MILLKIYLIFSLIVFMCSYLFIRYIANKCANELKNYKEYFGKDGNFLSMIQIFVYSFIPLVNLIMVYIIVFKSDYIYKKLKEAAVLEIIKNKRAKDKGVP